MQAMKVILMVLGGLWLLGLASCVMLGAGTAVVLHSVDTEKVARHVDAEVQREEIARHNELMNRRGQIEDPVMNQVAASGDN